VDIVAFTTRIPISELPSIIDEYCIINFNTDYAADYAKHQLNDALVIKRELD
jgi:hypothetical protein